MLSSGIAGEVSHELHQKAGVFPALHLVVDQVLDRGLITGLQHLHLSRVIKTLTSYLKHKHIPTKTELRLIRLPRVDAPKFIETGRMSQ